MELSFGARLRLQRERQQLDVTAIAARMKIKASLLSELEHDDVSHWPAGIYRRAYLRDYARAIGLDPEPVVREFMELYPDPMLGAAQQEAGATDDSAPPQAEATGFRRLLGAMPAVLRRAKSEPEPVGLTISRLLASAPREAVLAAPAPVRARSIDEPLSEAADLSTDAPADECALPTRFPGRGASLSGSPREPESVRATRTDGAHEARFDTDSSEMAHGAVPEPIVTPVDLAAVADVCTRLARATQFSDVVAVLADAADCLHAVGLVVWSWDAGGKALTASFAHGYGDAVLERPPSVRADAPNAIAAAFRAADVRVVDGSDAATGALAVPLMAPDGCAGVLALEVESGREHDEPLRAVATILAAQLATLLVVAPEAAAVSA